MKFIHLADLHLGKNVNDFSMIEDQKYILEKIIETVVDENIDAVIIAGDIYDRSIPSEEAVKLLDSFITNLAKHDKKVFAISGNHDSDERLNFASKLLSQEGIYIGGRYEGHMETIKVEDEFGVINIWLMPYIRASRVAHYHPDGDTSTYDAAFKTVISACEINSQERNIIVAHQFVTAKGNEPELAGSEIVMMNVGTLDKIGSDCFDAFDYVALGHIHSGQQVGKATCRYAGSILKYSLNKREINSVKTMPIVTLGEKGRVEVELKTIEPLRDVRHIKGRLEDLIKNAVDTEDYIYATLTDEDIRLDGMARMREVYPHIMKLDYDNEATRAMAESDAHIETEGRSFEQLMSDFFEIYHGMELNEAEWKHIMEAAKEAGVIQ